MDWYDRAACASAEPETFFPVGSGGVAAQEVAAAKAVCARCSVRAQCRDFALATRQAFGVWGGLDEEQRRLLSRGSPAHAIAT